MTRIELIDHLEDLLDHAVRSRAEVEELVEQVADEGLLSAAVNKLGCAWEDQMDVRPHVVELVALVLGVSDE